MPDSPDNDAVERPPFQLGEWTVEPMLDRISRGEEIVQLRPRVMDLLLCLVDAQETVVSKQRLIDRVWGTEFVTDNALTHAVAELRKKLGDDVRSPSYIETIPRWGYRVVAKLAVARPEVRPAQIRFALVDEKGNEVPLRDGDNLIGRSAEADVVIDTSEVSRRHARISIDGASALIEDLRSKNGTYLRGRRLEAPVRLQDEDEIQIGVSLATFRFKVVDDRTRTERHDHC